ncbi:MAG: MFS transporter [Candidatus Thorarchaeota archaeon]|nr:MFS transporter [Candidatus Thorarchaeota archaeon]
MEEAERVNLGRNVTVMTIGNTAIVSLNSLWIMFMPFFFTDIGIHPVTVLMFYTFFAAASAATSFFGGRLADRIGRKPALLFGYTIYSTGPLVILISLWFASQSLTTAALIAVMGYTGMMAGRGIARPAASILLVESSQKKKKGRSYMIATRVIPSIPAAVLVLVGSELYFSGDSLLSSQFSFAVLVGFVGLVAVFSSYGFLLRESHETKDLQQEVKSPSVWRSEAWFFLLVVAAFLLDAISSSGLSPYVPLSVRPIDEKLYGYMISISTLVIALAALGAGEIVDRLGTKAALTIGWGLLAFTIGIFPLFRDPLVILLLYAIWAGLDMMDISIPPIVIEEKFPKEVRATVMGTFSTVVNLGSIVGPALVSLALLYGEAIPFFMKAAMNLIGLFLFLLATRTLENKTQETEEKEEG